MIVKTILNKALTNRPKIRLLIACFLAFWIVLFFIGSFSQLIAKRSFDRNAKATAYKESSTNHSPVNSDFPDSVPEEKEENEKNEKEDSVDNDSRADARILYQFDNLISVKTGYLTDLLQHRVSIPLFVLHHSWKSFIF